MAPNNSMLSESFSVLLSVHATITKARLYEIQNLALTIKLAEGLQHTLHMK